MDRLKADNARLIPRNRVREKPKGGVLEEEKETIKMIKLFFIFISLV